MKEKLDKIFSSPPDDVSEELLFRYVEGKVSSEERRLIEERLADDPFLSDALDGLMAKKDPWKHRTILKELHKKIHKHASARMFKILPVWSVVQIAAAMLLIIISAWFINYIIKKPEEKIFTEQFKPYPPPTENTAPVISKKDKNFQPEKSTVPSSSGSDLKTEPNGTQEQEEIKNTTPSAANETPSSNLTNETAASDSKTTDRTLAPKENSAGSPQNTTAPNEAAKPEARQKTPLNEQEKKMVVTQPFPRDSTTIIQNQNPSKQLNDAIDFYKAGNYSQAISLFESILQSDSSNEVARFYCAISYLANGDASLALAQLKRMNAKVNDEYYEPTLWYESLAYIHKNEKNNAVDLLKKIVALNGNYKSRAENLLADLK